jgi:hypothetical protein
MESSICVTEEYEYKIDRDENSCTAELLRSVLVPKGCGKGWDKAVENMNNQGDINSHKLHMIKGDQN